MGKICDPPPFTGGQSEGVVYDVMVSWESYPTWARIAPYRDVTVIGPVYAIEPFENEDSANGVRIRSSGGVNRIAGNVNYSRNYQAYLIRADGQPDTGGDPPSANCRCSDDSCRVDCAGAPDGFCCIDHSFTDALLQRIKK